MNALSDQCDLGRGPGKVDGAPAQLPCDLANIDVIDLEARLVWCMNKSQRFDLKVLAATAFSNRDRSSDPEALTAFVANRSNGMTFVLKIEHPNEKEGHAVGEALFYRRQGPMDFGCVTCQTEDGKRLRLRQLPYFGDARRAQEVIATWLSYRFSQHTIGTIQQHTFDCYWQTRLPELDGTLLIFERDAEIALSPGFRWGNTILPGKPFTADDVYNQTAITYPACY